MPGMSSLTGWYGREGLLYLSDLHGVFGTYINWWLLCRDGKAWTIAIHKLKMAEIDILKCGNVAAIAISSSTVIPQDVNCQHHYVLQVLTVRYTASRATKQYQQYYDWLVEGCLSMASSCKAFLLKQKINEKKLRMPADVP
jgi:hypothetical protein